MRSNVPSPGKQKPRNYPHHLKSKHLTCTFQTKNGDTSFARLLDTIQTHFSFGSPKQAGSASTFSARSRLLLSSAMVLLTYGGVHTVPWEQPNLAPHHAPNLTACMESPLWCARNAAQLPASPLWVLLWWRTVQVPHRQSEWWLHFKQLFFNVLHLCCLLQRNVFKCPFSVLLPVIGDIALILTPWYQRFEVLCY